MLHMLNGTLESEHKIWGYRTPAEVEAKRKSWINARMEKALTGRYFRHCFEGKGDHSGRGLARMDRNDGWDYWGDKHSRRGKHILDRIPRIRGRVICSTFVWKRTYGLENEG